MTPADVPRRVPDGPQVAASAEVAVNLHRLDDGVAVHLVNYGYDDERDAAAVIADLELAVRLPGGVRAPRSCDPAGPGAGGAGARRGRRPRTPGRRRSLHRRGAAVRLAELAAVEGYRVVEVERPVPAAGELLVEVHACGVCASELDAWTGRVPADLPLRNGHEVSGVVAELGAGVTDFAVGDPVAVWTHRIRVRGVRDRPRRVLPRAGRRARSSAGCSSRSPARPTPSSWPTSGWPTTW